jgi:hypothetical protein
MTNPIPTMRSYLMCSAAATALLLGGAALTPAAAQARSASVMRSQACEKAIRLAVQGHWRRDEEEAWNRKRTPGRSKADWMWDVLPNCGAAGGAVAGKEWSKTRTLTDTTRLADAYSRVWSFRDASVFGAAASVATDRSATPQSRVYSMMLLVAQLFDRWDPTYDFFIATDTYDVCRFSSVTDRVIVTGATLPADARARARTLARAVEADVGAPRAVRSAGRCVDQAIEIRERVEAAGPISIPPS